MNGYRLNNAIAAPQELLFVPLGGVGEIGMNLALYFFQGKWVMVDMGVSFGEGLPGIDAVMADPSFIVERREDLLGLVLTHGHEDHIGAIPHLWSQLKCPIYATPFTAELTRHKMEEAGLGRELAKDAKLKVIPLGGKFALGPFGFEYIGMTHSIPEANALVIRTAAGTVLHSGDWKIDPEPLVGKTSDLARLAAVGDEGVTALVCDSTNVFKAGAAGSEAEVRNVLFDLVKQARSRVVVTCFASNLARVQSAAEAGRAAGRKVALVGRSLWRMDECARATGYWRNMPGFLSDEDAMDLPPHKVMLICTGSQGEPRAALARIAANIHPAVGLDEDDTVIFSSRIIPGNEKAIYALQDRLVRLGLTVISEEDHPVHVSGHPGRDELTEMFRLVRPNILVPVHGELRHLTEHAALGKREGIPHNCVIGNGDVLRLAPGTPTVIDRVHFGKLALDGNRLISNNATPIKERERMHSNGLVLASFVLNAKGKLLGAPQISMHGLVDDTEVSSLAGELSKAAADFIESLPPSERDNDGVIEEGTVTALRRVLKLRLGRRPIIDVHVLRV